MPRVLLLATSPEGGGAEAQVAVLAEELQRRGWDVERQSLAGLGLPGLRGLVRLIALLRRFRPQVLHCHLFHANVLGRALRLLCPAPVVISTLHSLAETGRESRDIRLRDWAYRLTDPLADAVAAVCTAAVDRHAAAGAVRHTKVRVIPNGVDLGRFRPQREQRATGEFVWLAAGRLMWKKDYPTLLRAFARQRGATLLIAGEGPDEPALRTLAQELGAKARLLGRSEDMAALYNAADAFVLSSVVEGLPMTLIEAAACGLPAVATDVGGVREIVRDGETGFVVPPGDVEALAGAMARLAALPHEIRARMSESARAHAEARFDIGAVVSEWERTYRELLQAAVWT